MTGDIDIQPTPAASADEASAGEITTQAVFPTREDALALALKIAGPKGPDGEPALG